MRIAAPSSLLAALLVAGLVACPAKPPEPPPEPVKRADVKPIDAVKPADAPRAESNPLCVGRAGVGPDEALEVGGKKYARKGSTVTLEGSDGDDEFVLGQITDIKDHTPENAANLKIAIEWLKTEKVDAIAVTGDLGESAESIQRVVEDVAAAGVPVLAIVGNRECRDHFEQGVKAAQVKFKNVINMNSVRVFNTDDVSIVSMPGYYNKSYIHCAEGCEYTPEDVKTLPEVAKAATSPTKILISHGPPLQTGALAIDRIHEGANVGDPVMTEVMKASGLFPFGMFGNIQEAGGHATNLTGETRVAPETYADSLYLNPGPIDSVRWVMLDGSESVGMAGLIHVKGKQAMYKIKRIKPGEAKVDGTK
ncbi:MAG: metallophosphoesterase [Deltaproteobacteria bacterium]|nr:metallophosphoesterase [Deltaproteobacteria bacterium]